MRHAVDMVAFRAAAEGSSRSPVRQFMVTYDNELKIVNDDIVYAIESVPVAPQRSPEWRLKFYKYNKDEREYMSLPKGLNECHRRLLLANLILTNSGKCYILDEKGKRSWDIFRQLMTNKDIGRHAFQSQEYNMVNTWNTEHLNSRGLNYPDTSLTLDVGENNMEILKKLDSNIELKNILNGA
jgi:hypothetical protein